MSVTPTTKESLTAYAANFICKTQLKDIPENVLDLGKKSMLDGLGLAIAGSVAKSGELVRKHLHAQGLNSGAATVIGSNLRCAPRFAAFANGVLYNKKPQSLLTTNKILFTNIL
jgi:2-methylcitrate dehydratase PrpD